MISIYEMKKKNESFQKVNYWTKFTELESKHNSDWGCIKLAQHSTIFKWEDLGKILKGQSMPFIIDFLFVLLNTEYVF